jgi:hypothetical protein
MEKWLDFATALFAIVAAVFWFLSAGNPPRMMQYWGSVPENDPFRLALVFSAKMNGWAAGLSGASALCMALKIMIQHTRH